MAEQNKMIYFDMRARGETIRMLHALAGEKLAEDRLDASKWPQIKSTIDAPLGQLPIYTTNKGRLCHSTTISRYVAKKFGLVGEGLWNETLNDLVAETLQEFVNSFIPKVFSWKVRKRRPEPVDGEKLVEEAKKDLLRRLAYIRTLKTGEHNFLFSDQIQLADVWVYTTLEWVRPVYPDTMEITPWIKEFVLNFESDPVICKYLADRPITAI
ncbi:glutathione S-transferase 3-like [Watersipora subatra]|uniref:glutathione S-transferase 3-like n=1 Tax=Watersipora subatra TaxID=2589382 RepID=UPI00355B37E4